MALQSNSQMYQRLKPTEASPSVRAQRNVKDTKPLNLKLATSKYKDFNNESLHQHVSRVTGCSLTFRREHCCFSTCPPLESGVPGISIRRHPDKECDCYTFMTCEKFKMKARWRGAQSHPDTSHPRC